MISACKMLCNWICESLVSSRISIRRRTLGTSLHESRCYLTPTSLARFPNLSFVWHFCGLDKVYLYCDNFIMCSFVCLFFKLVVEMSLKLAAICGFKCQDCPILTKCFVVDVRFSWFDRITFEIEKDFSATGRTNQQQNFSFQFLKSNSTPNPLYLYLKL